MADYSATIGRFQAVREASRANCWNVRCPCSERHKGGDKRPSGRLWVDEDSGRLCWWCAKGCKWREVMAATGTTTRHWFPPDDKYGGRSATRKGPMPGKVIASYDYTDEAGALLYQVCRTEPKGFFQRRPIPGHEGEWAYSLSEGRYVRNRDSGYWFESMKEAEGGDAVELPEIRRVPYRLPELVAKAEHPVLIVEGEGKADLLRSLGFVSTCSAGGAGKWPVKMGHYFTGRRVVIFPDLDDVGLMHAIQVAASCLYFGAASIRIINGGMGWLQLPEKSDVKDWLEPIPQAERKAKLVELIKQQTEWKPCK